MSNVRCMYAALGLSELKPGATAEFNADLDFVAVRSGNVAAIALWFDVSFCDSIGGSQASNVTPKVELGRYGTLYWGKYGHQGK